MHADPIAIVGAACRLPGARNLDGFWDVLSAGRDVVTEIPDGRWSKEFYFHPNPAERGRSYTWAAGIIDGIDQFDAAFFGISPREAEQIDPQQRLLLELASDALEDAGIPAARVAGSSGGVYIGASTRDFSDIRLGDPASGDAYFMTGLTASILANRVSYIFDLRGPSFTVDTACSSSLVALDLACKAISEQRVPLALVGGVNLMLAPYPFIGFCRAAMLSPHGRCFAFDARANGYVRAEGAGMVVLKPLGVALADGDRVRGVILGSGVNSDGRTIGLSLPNQAAQTALLRSVYGESGVSPDALSFIEAHGTGTAAGDPIELGALGEAIAQARRAPLCIGSVKTNLGHLEAASGMAGLLKTMLSLEHGIVPPSLNFETPNPRIPFADLNIEIVTQPTKLPVSADRWIAGVNSFGFGGTNAHVIMASGPPASHAPGVDGGATLAPLLISARSEAALSELARAWSHRLADATADAARPMITAAARRRDHHKHRLVAWGDSPAEIALKLDLFSQSGHAAPIVAGSALATGKLAFIFSGNGVQRPGMAGDAIRHSPAFRSILDEVDESLRPMLGWSIAERLLGDQDPRLLARTDIAQPLLFAVQVGVTAALRCAGVDAAAYAGHSVGEVAAAWASGALSLADACRIIAVRSEQQQRTQGLGGMAALGLAPEPALEILTDLGGGLELAAINSAAQVTVSGPRQALARLEARAKREGWRYTPLDLDYAFHSAALDPIERDIIAGLTAITPPGCGLRFVSTVTGAPVPGTDLDGTYWWRNVREPVRFSQAMRHLIDDGVGIFVEIGPHPALQSYIRDALKTAEITGRVMGSLTLRATGNDPFPAIAAECHAAGHDISGARMFDGPADFRRLPGYPWQREPYWFVSTGEGLFPDSPARDHPLLGFRRVSENTVWSNVLALEIQPWLGDHRVEGMPVVAGAALLEIALAAARSIHPDAPSLEVANLEIPRALAIEQGQSRELRVRAGSDGRIEIASRARLTDEPWSVHAVARIGQGTAHTPQIPAPLPTAARTVTADALYALADRLGLEYGPAFRTVRAAEIIDASTAIVRLRPGTGLADGMILDPALCDGAVQGFLALLADRFDIAPGESFMPARFGRVRVFAPHGRAPTTARVTIKRAGSRSISAAIGLFDAVGLWIAEIDDCWFQRVRLKRRDTVEARTFRFDLAAAPRPEDIASPEMNLDSAIEVALAGASQPRDYAEAALLFDAYVAGSAQAALTAITGGTGPFRIDDLVFSGDIAGDAAPLARWLLAMIARQGGAMETPEGWRIVGDPDLPEPAVIWRTLIAEAPELAAELALVAGDPLGNLREGLKAAPLPAALVEQMLYASPSGGRAIDTLCRAVAALAAEFPAGRPLRVLEIGAGSGALTRRVLSSLAGWNGTLTYLATEPDAAMLPRLNAATGGHLGLTIRRWDPRADSAPPERFDLAISAYGMTRLRLGPDAIARLYGFLAPGGVLISLEPEPNDVWNAVFGQAGDWWHANPADDFPAARMRRGIDTAGMMEMSGLSALSPIPIAGGLWPVSLLAGTRPVQPDTDPETRGEAAAILIATAGDTLAAMLARRLSALGISTRTIDPPEVADGAALCAALIDAGSEPPQVICLPPPADVASAMACGTAARMTAILTVARLAVDVRARAGLWIVTRDAQASVADRTLPAPGEAALWGIGRTIRNEWPELDCRLVDFPSGWSHADSARRLAAEIAAPDPEREIVWLDSGRYASRLRRGLPEPAAKTGAIGLTCDRPGLLDSLRWAAVDDRNPAAGEVAITVKAAGLNFRDVMWAMALLPEEALLGGFSGPTLGLECTGIVSAVGAGVDGFAVGDRVMALAPAALRSRVVTAAHAVAMLPDRLDFAAGATIPVAYLTVLYGLGTLARLREDEWVLIHGGAGGVGLAAIEYARHRGAIIVATAGSDIKRAFLRRLGVDHVLDSRGLDFADQVRELTGGAGVDVVLNSLGGEAMERSLGLLRPFGRFVELGKRDFMLDTPIGLRALRQNIAYFAVDVDRLPVERPELAANLMREVTLLLESGAIHPLPYRTYPFAEAPEAFRLMQGAGHIGKVFLTEDGHTVSRPPDLAPLARPDLTYLVTGGLSGFGLETARWLARQGARHLALVSRRGGGAPEAAGAIAGLRAASGDARAFACDAADADALAATLAEIRRSMPPLGGVVHAAMVLDDGLLADLTAARIERVLAPKLDGARNLDRLTRGDPIELFLLYSSATTVLGAPGQGSYVAANAAIEAIAKRRTAEGLPALAVAWGPIADAGVLARDDAMRDALLRRLAATPMTAAEALDALPVLMASGAPVVAFAPVRWEAASQYLPILDTPAFTDVSGGRGQTDTVDLRETLHALPQAEAGRFILGLLTEEAARVLSFAPDRIDPGRPLSEFGMDSLMAVELRLALETRLGIDVPLVSLSDSTSLATIAARMARSLSQRETTGQIAETIMRYETASPQAVTALGVTADGGLPANIGAAE